MEFSSGFYLHDDEWLFGDQTDREPLRYSGDFVRRTGGDYFSFLELRSVQDLGVADACFASGERFGQYCERHGFRFGEELHMSKSSHLFTSTGSLLKNGEDPRDPDVAQRLLQMGCLALHEGKTFHQFTDHWGERPRYVVHVQQLAGKDHWLKSIPFYRLAFRDIASSTNERTLIFSLLAPSVFGNTAPCERQPFQRSNSSALKLMSLANSFATEWTIRVRAAAHVNLFILNAGRIPNLPSAQGLLVHSALRLVSNHSGYARLWSEQMGDTWREARQPFSWPVLQGEDERWRVLATIDATVAHGFNLTRSNTPTCFPPSVMPAIGKHPSYAWRSSTS